MAYEYLMENYPSETQQMVEDGSITEYLNKIQDETTAQVQKRIRELLDRDSKNSFQENLEQQDNARRTAEEEILSITILSIIPKLVDPDQQKI